MAEVGQERLDFFNQYLTISCKRWQAHS